MTKSSAVTSRFGITVWPGDEISVPPVPVVDVELVDGQWLEFDEWLIPWTDPGDPEIFSEIPEELYLREVQEVDLNDPEAIRDFCANYGRVGHPSWGELGMNHLWTRVSSGEFSVVYHDVSMEWNRRKQENPQGYDPFDQRQWAHVNEVAAHLAVIRNCTNIWRNHLWRGADFSDDDLAFIPWDGTDLAGASRPPTVNQAATYLAESLSMGLQTFHAHVRLTEGQKVQGMFQAATTYAALCLQLYNHIASDAPYHVCANETCGRVFVTQRNGRSEYGIRRTEGVKYCSRSCANAQAQREYRRRQKKEEAEG